MGGTSTKDLDYSGGNNKRSFNNQGQDEEFLAETVGIKSKFKSEYIYTIAILSNYPTKCTKWAQLNVKQSRCVN